MNRPQDKDSELPQHPKEARESQFRGTHLGGLYDRHGPIPVPDAKESDSESLWALFEEPSAKGHQPEAASVPQFAETTIGDGGFEPTNFGGPAFAATNIAPLKP
ncbi:MAG: hypothetical protein RLZZ494_916 [Pseudomonadota bacterium]|jgi:hypothetical protein